MRELLSIAGLEFSLLGKICSSDFGPEFDAFWMKTASGNAACEVRCVGPDQKILDEPVRKDRPWYFVSSHRQCVIERRTRDGELLWKMEATPVCDAISISWHPTLFREYYDSCGQAWETGLGLTVMVLSLRLLGGVVMHGAASRIGDSGILCTGVSGVGKSTISRILDEAGCRVLTDERPLLRQWNVSDNANSSSRFRIFGSPWPSSAGFACNDWAPLSRIYFLEHGSENAVVPLTPGDAFNRLTQVTTIPWQDPSLFDPCLQTIETLLTNVPAAVLSFRPDEAVVDVIRRDLAAERVIV